MCQSAPPRQAAWKKVRIVMETQQVELMTPSLFNMMQPGKLCNRSSRTLQYSRCCAIDAARQGGAIAVIVCIEGECARTHTVDCRSISFAGANLNAEVSWASPLLLDQVLSACYEVSEGVLLVQVLAVLIPVAPHFTPTPHMGQGKHKASVYERQSVGTQVRVIAYLIRAVPVKSITASSAHGIADALSVCVAYSVAF